MKRTTSQASSIMIPKKGKINMTKTSVTNKGLGWRTKDTQTKDTQTKDTQTKDTQTKGKEIKNQKKRGGKEERKDQKKKKTLRGNKEKPDHIGEG